MNILSWTCIGLEHDIMHMPDIKPHINKAVNVTFTEHSWVGNQSMSNKTTTPVFGECQNNWCKNECSI